MRRRRSLANITTVTDHEMVSDDVIDEENVNNNNDNNNSSFSESLRLFQSLQVLANEDDREALRNETESSEEHRSSNNLSLAFPGVLVDEADYCFSSMMFSSVVGVVVLVMIMSGVTISLLCTRLRRERRDGKETAADVVHTLR